MITGTLYNTVKLQSMTNNWMQKKDSGQILSKQEQEKRANWTQEERMIHDFNQQMIDEREAKKKREICDKITSGGELTAEEEQYLEQHDPEALRRYRDGKIEKKAYEDKLKKCKTKDEVQRLKNNTINGYMASIKKIENNPCIPASAKLAKAEEILTKLTNINQAEKKFMATAEYKNLPTEAEETKERNEEVRERNEKVISEIAENAKENEIIMDTEEVESAESSENIVNMENAVNIKDDKVSNDAESIEDIKDFKITEKDDNIQEAKVDHKNILTDDKKPHKTKRSRKITEPQLEIKRAYERIKLNAQLELNDLNTTLNTNYEKSRGKKVDYTV